MPSHLCLWLINREMHYMEHFLDRFELAKASRAWRQGVPTALVMDQNLHMLQDAAGVQVVLCFTAPAWHSASSCLLMCCFAEVMGSTETRVPSQNQSKTTCHSRIHTLSAFRSYRPSPCLADKLGQVTPDQLVVGMSDVSCFVRSGMPHSTGCMHAILCMVVKTAAG